MNKRDHFVDKKTQAAEVLDRQTSWLHRNQWREEMHFKNKTGDWNPCIMIVQRRVYDIHLKKSV